MTQIKAFIFRENDGDKTITVIMQDGGVATAYNPEADYYRTNYYQEKMTPDTTLENMWDELGEGEMYWADWDGKDEPLINKATTEEENQIIDDMIAWLYIATEEVEVVKVEMGELNDETFNKVKEQLILE